MPSEWFESLFGAPDLQLLVMMAGLMFFSSVLQTATGFGFAILSAPIGAALIGGPEIVTTILITGTAVDLLILLLRREPPGPRWDEVGIIGLSSVPGLLVGAYLLAVLSQQTLLFVIAVAVVLAVGFRIRTTRTGGGKVPIASRRWGIMAGGLAGVLATSTTLAGPPIVYYLQHRPYSPTTTRDTLVMVNLVRLPISVIALLLGAVLVVLPGMGWLVLAALGGFFVGGAVFRRLDAQRYEALVLALLTLAAGTALVLALAT